MPFIAYQDLPTSAKAVDIGFEQAHATLEPKDTQAKAVPSLALKKKLSKKVSISDGRKKLDSMLMEHETEIRNDYRMVGETGYCSMPSHNSRETIL